MKAAASSRRWKVAIYLESRGSGIGGAEYCVAVLAAELSAQHDVEILHHKDDLDRARLEDMFHEDLSRATIRQVAPRDFDAFYEVRNPWRRYRLASTWWADLSAGYDLFVVITHVVPPFCHAKAGLLYSLFPIYELPVDSVMQGGAGFPGRQVQALKNLYQRFEWRRRMDSYPVVASISEFTRTWTRRRWHVDSRVVYPPAHPGAGSRKVDASAKDDVILSIGRFTRTAHPKRQLEMMQAFARMQRARPSDWSYHCVGSISSNAEDRAYFDEVDATANGIGGQVAANLDRSTLDSLLGRAKIFWHATGLGIDAERRPEKLEHYGIVTVEAMAAGCVPVVIARGGQPEIVEHGVSGFVWNDVDELCAYTRQLMDDDALRLRMSAAAIERARRFSRPRFVEGMTQAIATLAPRIERASHAGAAA